MHTSLERRIIAALSRLPGGATLPALLLQHVRPASPHEVIRHQQDVKAALADLVRQGFLRVEDCDLYLLTH